MKKSVLNHDSPEVLEVKRIAEIRLLTHLERLERLMAILEISYLLKIAPKIQVKNR